VKTARRCALAARLALVVLVAGCTTAPRSPDEAPLAAVPDVAFDAAGRLSARHGSEAAAANFRWTHSPARDELELASPLGQTLARLAGDAASVRLELPDGRTAEASDWQALTTRVLGAPIPVRGLAWWIRGTAHPQSTHRVERDAASRALVLQQDGWEIVYDYAADAPRPNRLRMSYPDTEIRLVVDTWAQR
jgi:outer membrane lipoprotein LolB